MTELMAREKNNYVTGSMSTSNKTIPFSQITPLQDATAFEASNYNILDEKSTELLVGEPQKEYTNSGVYLTLPLEKGRDKVDNNRLLEMYIEKMNQDQSDLKNDMRSSEDRITRSIERMESKIDNMQKNLGSKIDDIQKDTSAKIDGIQKDIGEMKNEVSNKLNDMQRDILSYKTSLWNIAITCIVTIAGIVMAVIFGMPAWLAYIIIPK